MISLGSKVRYKKLEGVIPTQGVGIVVRILTDGVLVQWGRIRNVCKIEDLEVAE